MKITPTNPLTQEFLDESLVDAFQDQPEIAQVLNQLLVGKILHEKASPHKTFTEITTADTSQRTFYPKIHAFADQVSTLYPQLFRNLQQDPMFAMKKQGMLILDEHIAPHSSKTMEGVDYFYSTTKKGSEFGLSQPMCQYYWNGVEYPVD